jgi:predicted RNase H-like HicB family nuclease
VTRLPIFDSRLTRDEEVAVKEVIMRTFSAYVEWDPETRLYVGTVPGIPGAHTQAATLDELRDNLKEVLELCLDEYSGPIEDLPHFVGLQQVEVGV